MAKGLYFSLLLLLFPNAVCAKGIYQSAEQFVVSTLGKDHAVLKSLWLTADDKQAIANILEHKYSRLRIRYWQKEQQRVWVLEEVGKEKPITIGVHIADQQIKQLKVLTYRESRGDEVKHSFFTDQFIDAKLTGEHQLDRSIDGITGATLSVRALTKVARLALWLSSKALNTEALNNKR